MTLLDEIHVMIKCAIDKGYSRFIVYPYGYVGKAVKDILNSTFGIIEEAIVDDGLSMKNKDIYSSDLLMTGEFRECAILLSSTKTEIYEDLYKKAFQMSPIGSVFELPSMAKIHQDNNENPIEIKDIYNSNYNKCMLVLFWISDERGDIGYYFLPRKQKKIAIWGVDELACQFAQLSQNSKFVELCGMFFSRELGYGLRYPSTVRTGAYIRKTASPFDIISEHPDIDIIIFFEDFGYVSQEERFVAATTIFGPDPYTGPICGAQDIHSLSIFKQTLEHNKIGFISVSYPMGYEFNWFPLTKKRISKEKRKEWQIKENSFSSDQEYYAFQTEKLQAVEANEKLQGYDYPPFSGKYLRFERNQRIIEETPDEVSKRIIIAGPCMISDILHVQGKSFGDILQYKLIDRGIKRRVQSFVQKPNISRHIVFRTAVEELRLLPDDVFVWVDLSPRVRNPDIDLHDLCEELYKEYDEEYFMDVPYHMNNLGMSIVCDLIVDKILEKNLI